MVLFICLYLCLCFYVHLYSNFCVLCDSVINFVGPTIHEPIKKHVVHPTQTLATVALFLQFLDKQTPSTFIFCYRSLILVPQQTFDMHHLPYRIYSSNNLLAIKNKTKIQCIYKANKKATTCLLFKAKLSAYSIYNKHTIRAKMSQKQSILRIKFQPGKSKYNIPKNYYQKYVSLGIILKLISFVRLVARSPALQVTREPKNHSPQTELHHRTAKVRGMRYGCK